MFTLVRLLLLAILIVPVGATTLEQLGLDEMIEKSSAVVRAKVTGTYTAARGSEIYTHYVLEISDEWKGSGAKSMDVAVPGGTLKGIRQNLPGAPSLTVGEEYVLFLWTSRSGFTQVIGLSQGLFNVRVDASGNPILIRPAATEVMVGKDGRVVTDQPLTIHPSDLRTRVRATQPGATR